jgi:hypothetical protein
MGSVILKTTAVAVFLASMLTAQAAKQLNGFVLEDPLIPARLIQSGGPPRDGIPALTAPDFVSVEDASLRGADRVLGVVANGIAKAYPIRIMNYHEIVNDRFADTPVAVTFCPLCGTGIAFHAEAGGAVRTFGVSGLLYNSDVLMYDRQSESLWSQIMGRAISGPAKGAILERLPTRHTSWQDWKSRYPETLVLAAPTGYGRNYRVDPYQGYADSRRVWFPVANKDRRLFSKAVVIGLALDNRYKAYPFNALPEEHSLIQDEFAGQQLTIEYDLDATAARVLNSDGEEIPTFTAYWFAWGGFHRDPGLYHKQ